MAVGIDASILFHLHRHMGDVEALGETSLNRADDIARRHALRRMHVERQQMLLGRDRPRMDVMSVAHFGHVSLEVRFDIGETQAFGRAFEQDVGG